ncbi:MAG TPA: ankyrin repeat domain-containing protein [Gammaproteobacteria bacterium]|nr:ankyrin repeat domain-containing protein [Gammaproteobacteria bacterium]
MDGRFVSACFGAGVVRAAAPAFVAAAALAAFAPTLGSERLTDAVRAGDAAAVSALLRQGASGHAEDADGTTALHWAVRADDVELARALLRAGAHARAANRYGVTPLALAAENGNAAMMTLLLDAGADPSAAAGEGETVLMTAARTGRPEAVKLLLAHGADPNATERAFGETALMWAAGHGHADAIRALAAGGAKLDAHAATIDLPPTKVNFSFAVTTALPRGGMTALMYAAREGQLDAATALAEAGADLNAVDPEGTTALVIAIINAHYDVAARLVEEGADPNIGDTAGMAALYAAVDMVHMAPFVNRPSPRASGSLSSADLVTVLLEHGANPNAALRAPLLMRQHNGGDPSLGNGATPLMRAAKAADVALMQTLLDHGADPSRAMANGNTALLVAVSGRAGSLTPDAPMFQAVQLLLDRGAGVNAAASNGETLLHRGVVRGEAFVRMLVQRGARVDLKDAGGRTPLDVALGVPPPAPVGRGPGAGGPPGGPGGAPAGADDATIGLLRELGAPRG